MYTKILEVEHDDHLWLVDVEYNYDANDQSLAYSCYIMSDEDGQVVIATADLDKAVMEEVELFFNNEERHGLARYEQDAIEALECAVYEQNKDRIKYGC